MKLCMTYVVCGIFGTDIHALEIRNRNFLYTSMSTAVMPIQSLRVVSGVRESVEHVQFLCISAFTVNSCSSDPGHSASGVVLHVS